MREFEGTSIKLITIWSKRILESKFFREPMARKKKVDNEAINFINYINSHNLLKIMVYHIFKLKFKILKIIKNLATQKLMWIRISKKKIII